MNRFAQVLFLALISLAHSVLAQAEVQTPICLNLLKIGLQNTETRLRINEYRMDRNFFEYADSLPMFETTIGKMLFDPTATWVNIGGGVLNAEAEFFHTFGLKAKMSVVSMNVELPHVNQLASINKLLSESPSRFRHVTGKLRTHDLGPLAPGPVIFTDLASALSYSDRPDLELLKYSELAKEGDYLFFSLLGGSNFVLRDIGFGSSELARSGKKVTYGQVLRAYTDRPRDYIQAIRGWDILEMKNLNGGLGVAMRRNGEQLYIPELLPEIFVDDLPPIRAYLWDSRGSVPQWKRWIRSVLP